MLSKIKKLLGKKPKPPKATGRTVDYTRQGWGFATHGWYPHEQDEHLVDMMGHGGHLVKGDDILLNMRSGKIMRLRVKKIKYLSDPADMWDGTLFCIRYEE